MKRLHILVLIQLLVLTGWAGEPPFLMSVESVFNISGRGTVVCGRVERGSIQVGQPVELVGLGKDAKTVVTGIDSFLKSMDKAEAGKDYGLLLRGVTRDQVLRGQVLAAPGSIQAHADFTAKIEWLPNGRTGPITAADHPYCQFRTASVTGDWVDLAQGLEPKGETTLKLHLQQPVALEEGQAFTITLASRPVAKGTVTAIPKS